MDETSRSTLYGPGYEVTVEQKWETIRSIGRHELDPAWSYTDKHGHTHTSLDTLEWVVTYTYWCEMCRDDHERGEYRCRECRARVAPCWIWSGPDETILPGLATITLTLDDGRRWYLQEGEREVNPFAMEAWVEKITTSRACDEIVAMTFRSL